MTLQEQKAVPPDGCVCCTPMSCCGLAVHMGPPGPDSGLYLEMGYIETKFC